MRNFLYLSAIVTLTFIVAGNTSTSRTIPRKTLTHALSNIPTNDTAITLQNGDNELSVFIRIPKNKAAIGVIMLLPGWNLSVTDWCTKTSFCQKAIEQGYILVMPDMGKSIYAYQLYPETRKDWRVYATRKWMVDTFIPHLQANYNLLLPSQNNYLLGLSTGARGVALLCLDCPSIFKKGAALSGDYDPVNMPTDALLNGFYGSLSKFRERWTGFDNIVYRTKELRIPLYLGHGAKDKVVPCAQTQQFADSLRKFKPSLVTCHINDTAGHNYGYWESETNHVLQFFEEK